MKNFLTTLFLLFSFLGVIAQNGDDVYNTPSDINKEPVQYREEYNQYDYNYTPPRNLVYFQYYSPYFPQLYYLYTWGYPNYYYNYQYYGWGCYSPYNYFYRSNYYYYNRPNYRYYQRPRVITSGGGNRIVRTTPTVIINRTYNQNRYVAPSTHRVVQHTYQRYSPTYRVHTGGVHRR